MAKRRNDMDRGKFIATAERLILDKGANDFSLADLAKTMGISKGTLYYHYPTKDELILDIMEEHMSQLSKDYLDWFARHKDDQISEERFLDVIFYKGVKLFNRSKMQIYIVNECMRGNKSLRDRYVELWESWERKILEGIAKVFPDTKDKEGFAYTLMLLIDGMVMEEALSHDDEEMAERMKSIVLEKGAKA